MNEFPFIETLGGPGNDQYRSLAEFLPANGRQSTAQDPGGGLRIMLMRARGLGILWFYVISSTILTGKKRLREVMKRKIEWFSILLLFLSLVGCQEKIPPKETIRMVRAVQVSDPADFVKRWFPD